MSHSQIINLTLVLSLMVCTLIHKLLPVLLFASINHVMLELQMKTEKGGPNQTGVTRNSMLFQKSITIRY